MYLDELFGRSVQGWQIPLAGLTVENVIIPDGDFGSSNGIIQLSWEKNSFFRKKIMLKINLVQNNLKG